jgi:hypothetical protein
MLNFRIAPLEIAQTNPFGANASQSYVELLIDPRSVWPILNRALRKLDHDSDNERRKALSTVKRLAPAFQSFLCDLCGELASTWNVRTWQMVIWRRGTLVAVCPNHAVPATLTSQRRYRGLGMASSPSLRVSEASRLRLRSAVRRKGEEYVLDVIGQTWRAIRRRDCSTPRDRFCQLREAIYEAAGSLDQESWDPQFVANRVGGVNENYMVGQDGYPTNLYAWLQLMRPAHPYRRATGARKIFQIVGTDRRLQG